MRELDSAIARRPAAFIFELRLAPTARAVRILTDDQRVAHYIRTAYGEIAREGRTPAAMDEGTIFTASTPAAVAFNGMPLDRTRPAGGTNPWTSGGYIIDQFVWRALAADPEWLAVYASAVSIDGQAFVFAGASGTGKTTLALVLAGSGAGVYGDEMILIRRRDRMVDAIPRRVMVREGTFALLDRPELSARIRAAASIFGTGSETVFACDRRVFGAIPAAAPLRAVAIVEREADAAAIHALTPARTAIALGAYLQPPASGFAAFSALTETIAYSNCLRLSGAEPARAAAAVRHAVCSR